MVGLVAASDGRGGAWAAWLGAPIDKTHLPTDLWTGHFIDGHWTDVGRIYSGLDISPFSLSISDGGSRGEPLISIASDSGMRGEDPHGMGIFRRAGTKWTTRWVSTGMFVPQFSEIQRVSDQRLLVSYVGSRHRNRELADSNQIWLSRSDDNGDSWSEFRSIGNVWNFRGNWLEIRASSPSDIHMMWMKDRERDNSVLLISTRSTDGGNSWQPPQAVTLPRLKHTTTFAYKEGFAIIAGDVLDSLALVELRNDEPLTSERLPWQGRTLPARATTFGEAGPAFIVWGQLLGGSYPMFPALDVPASAYSWITACPR